jgi:integrating conjugative element protein (TIGR03761 family)
MTEATLAGDRKDELEHALPKDPGRGTVPTKEQPGTLRGSASLPIETRQAQRLVYGRRESAEQPAIVGLVRFALLMKRLWLSAMLDDPYADWFLIRVLEALDSGRQAIGDRRRELDALLANAAGVQIEVARSLKPVSVPLQFATPYGYMGAYLIADFDALARRVLTARHVGLLAREEAERLLQRGGRPIRHAFCLPLRWTHCAIDRDDVRQHTQRAQAARLAMGELPQDVLEGTRRAAHAPAIRQRPATPPITVNGSTDADASV